MIKFLTIVALCAAIGCVGLVVLQHCKRITFTITYSDPPVERVEAYRGAK